MKYIFVLLGILLSIICKAQQSQWEDYFPLDTNIYTYEKVYSHKQHAYIIAVNANGDNFLFHSADGINYNKVFETAFPNNIAAWNINGGNYFYFAHFIYNTNSRNLYATQGDSASNTIVNSTSIAGINGGYNFIDYDNITQRAYFSGLGNYCKYVYVACNGTATGTIINGQNNIVQWAAETPFPVNTAWLNNQKYQVHAGGAVSRITTNATTHTFTLIDNGPGFPSPTGGNYLSPFNGYAPEDFKIVSVDSQLIYIRNSRIVAYPNDYNETTLWRYNPVPNTSGNTLFRVESAGFINPIGLKLIKGKAVANCSPFGGNLRYLYFWNKSTQGNFSAAALHNKDSIQFTYQWTEFNNELYVLGRPVYYSPSNTDVPVLYNISLLSADHPNYYKKEIFKFPQTYNIWGGDGILNFNNKMYIHCIADSINVNNKTVYESDGTTLGTYVIGTQTPKISVSNPVIVGNYLYATANTLSRTHPVRLSTFSTVNIAPISKPKLEIYPNPCNNTVYLSKANNADSYIIISVQGTVVKKGNINLQKSIDVSSLSNGSYCLLINNEVLHFIKQ
jgi:hypothetical protein